jgi:hypothetical protein
MVAKRAGAEQRVPMLAEQRVRVQGALRVRQRVKKKA